MRYRKPSDRIGLCTACGRPVRLHWGTRNTFVGCVGAIAFEPLESTRLRYIHRLRANILRSEALNSLRKTPTGKWSVCRAGLRRRRRQVFTTLKLAVAAVDTDHNTLIRALLEAS